MWERSTYLGDLAQCPALLSKINHNAATAVLGFLYGLLDTEDEVRPTSADVRPEDVAAIALLGPRQWSDPTRVRSADPGNVPRRGYAVPV